MADLRRIMQRLLTLFRVPHLEQDLDEELSFHVQMQAEEYVRRGMTPERARTEALKNLGGMEMTKEQVREVSRARFVETFLRDVRYGLRRMMKRPVFTGIAILMLALGIGANTAIFSLVYQAVIEPLPYPEPDRILSVYERNDNRGYTRSAVCEPNFLDFQERNTSFLHLGAYRRGSAVLTGPGTARQLATCLTTHGFFPTLGIESHLGRTFLPDEDISGNPARVVILAHGFWQEAFAGDQTMIGSSITLNGEPHTVVGILEPGEYWQEWYDIYLPLGADAAGDRNNHILSCFGRLRPGVTPAQAAAELDRIALEIGAENAEADLTGTTLVPLRDWLHGQQAPRTLLVLLGAVGFVLLLACLNLANILLAQATARRREIAVISALGADRHRIIRQLITESLILTAIGGAVGVILAGWGIGFVKALDPGGIPRLEQVTLNSAVLLFTAILTIATGFAAGIIPAWQATRSPTRAILQEGGSRTISSPGRRRLQGGLVITEMALSLVLLIGAGLMLASLNGLVRSDVGFAPGDRLLFDVELPENIYSPPGPPPTSILDLASRNDRADRLLETFISRIEAHPAVQAAGAVSVAPMGSWSTNMTIITAENAGLGEEATLLADWRYVTPHYFEAMGLGIKRGRTWYDLSNTEIMSGFICSENLAEALWPGENPLDREALLWGEEDTRAPVLGVVEDMRERGLGRDMTRAVYLSYALDLWNPVTFVVHTEGDPYAVVPDLRAILADLDPDLPIANVRTLEESLQSTLTGSRFSSVIFGLFALVALILGCAGLFGVVAYGVGERAPELAVRLTLGALPQGVVGLIVRQGMIRALIGIGLGLAAAVGLSRFMQGMLYEVTPVDPVIYATVTLILLAVAFLSCLLPALRVTRLDPIEALRTQ